MDGFKHYSSSNPHHPALVTSSRPSNKHHPSSRIQYTHVDDEDPETAQEQEQEDDNVCGGGGFDGSDDEDGEEEDEEEDGDPQNGYHHHHTVAESLGSERYKKKRKLSNLDGSGIGGGGYEFVPRACRTQTTVGRQRPPQSQYQSADWEEHATFVLLETWGERFLQLGRKSLRSDDWNDVAEKVSGATKSERTQMQCRNRLDTLKKRYKKEKAKLGKSGEGSSKWVYFNKIDGLMASLPKQHYGLACGVDSGEYVFTDPDVYLIRSNGFDEMRDSPSDSEASNDNGDDDGDDSDGLPPGRMRFGGNHGGDLSFRLLANSIEKFGKIYEKIENSKREQMMELEKMRMDFHQELELKKKQMFERAQIEIAKTQQQDDRDTDASA